jgi:hypothetical protein
LFTYAFSIGRPITRGGLLHSQEVVRLERTQEAPAIQDRRSFDMILSALQEATWVFVARLRDACPAPTDAGTEPHDDPPPNRDYF